MHHYGVLGANIKDGNFWIILRNKITEAEITISGPLEALYDPETDRQFTTRDDIKEFADKIGRFFMQELKLY